VIGPDYTEKQGSPNKRIPNDIKSQPAKYQRDDKVLQPSRSPPLWRVDDTAFIGQIPHTKPLFEHRQRKSSDDNYIPPQADQRQRKTSDDNYTQPQHHQYPVDPLGRVRKLSVDDTYSQPYYNQNQYFDQNDRSRKHSEDQPQQYNDNRYNDQMYNDQQTRSRNVVDHQFNEHMYHDRQRKLSADSLSSSYPHPEFKTRQDSLPDPRDIQDFMLARGRSGSIDRSNIGRMGVVPESSIGSARSAKTSLQPLLRQNQEFQSINTRPNHDFHPINTRQQDFLQRPAYQDPQSPRHRESSRYQDFPQSPRDQRPTFDRPDRQQLERPQFRNQPTRPNPIALPKANFDEYGTPSLEETTFRSRDIRRPSEGSNTRPKTPINYDRPRTPNIERIKTPNFDRPERSKTPNFDRPERIKTPNFDRPERSKTPNFDRPERSKTPNFDRPERGKTPNFDRSDRPVTPTNERSERPFTEERKRKGSKGEGIGSLMRNVSESLRKGSFF
jgi:hypothetical protein